MHILAIEQQIFYLIFTLKIISIMKLWSNGIQSQETTFTEIVEEEWG